jgi:hypothetical protein
MGFLLGLGVFWGSAVATWTRVACGISFLEFVVKFYFVNRGSFVKVEYCHLYDKNHKKYNADDDENDIIGVVIVLVGLGMGLGAVVKF